MAIKLRLKIFSLLANYINFGIILIHFIITSYLYRDLHFNIIIITTNNKIIIIIIAIKLAEITILLKQMTFNIK